MNNKMIRWMKNNSIDLIALIGVILLEGILYWGMKTRYHTINQYLYTIYFTASGLGALFFLVKQYQKNKFFSIYLIVIINIIMLFQLFSLDISISGTIFLIINALLYFVLAFSGVLIVYLAKRNISKNFNQLLVLSIITVIVGFAGIYSNMYNMYFSEGYIVFEIDEKVSFSQALISDDFIYYSADSFFGTNISNVSIAYTDYMDLQDKDNLISLYPSSFNNVNLINAIIKLLSIIESILFLVYISIIVIPLSSKKEELRQESSEKQSRDISEKIYAINQKMDCINKEYRIQSDRLSKILALMKENKKKGKKIT